MPPDPFLRHAASALPGEAKTLRQKGKRAIYGPILVAKVFNFGGIDPCIERACLWDTDLYCAPGFAGLLI